MNVFVSSVIAGFEPFRDAAAAAARALGHEVRWSEDFGASTAPPQRVCLDGVRWSDVVILLLGARYGDVQASGLSATHEEYREARDTTGVLAFAQTGITRDPDQERFVAEVRDWAGGHIAPSFATPERFATPSPRACTSTSFGSRRRLSTRKRCSPGLPLSSPGSPDTEAQRSRWLSREGPKQQVIRPAEIADPELARDLTQLAMFGPNPVLDSREGARPERTGGILVLAAQNAAVAVDQLGTVRVTHQATRSDALGTSLPAVLEEDLAEDLARDLRFAGGVLDRIDGRGRISEVVPAVGLVLGGAGFRTRAEHAASPNSMTMPRTMALVSVHLTPAARRRAALLHDTPALVEDLVALIKDAVAG